ncbi:MAG: DNA polymerase III subunit delta' [Halioglobus sp.]
MVQALNRNELPQSLILLGEEHTGKVQLALSISRRLLCSQPRDSLNCGQCHACELSASGSHGDFLWVEPEGTSRAIKIDQIRQLVQFASRTAGFGTRKVIVLAPADRMNRNAYNSLLKSLEEPAKDTFLLLVCHRMTGVPPTIRSRCQILRLATPDRETSLAWLEQTTGSRNESAVLLDLADGLPLLAMQIHASGRAEEYARDRLAMQQLLQGSLSVLEASTRWSEVELHTFLDSIVSDLQRILRTLPPEQLRLPQGRAVFGFLDELVRLQRAVRAGANPNRQLLVDSVVSRLSRILGTGPLGDKIRPLTGGPGL